MRGVEGVWLQDRMREDKVQCAWDSGRLGFKFLEFGGVLQS